MRQRSKCLASPAVSQCKLSRCYSSSTRCRFYGEMSSLWEVSVLLDFRLPFCWFLSQLISLATRFRRSQMLSASEVILLQLVEMVEEIVFYMRLYWSRMADCCWMADQISVGFGCGRGRGNLAVFGLGLLEQQASRFWRCPSSVRQFRYFSSKRSSKLTAMVGTILCSNSTLNPRSLSSTIATYSTLLPAISFTNFSFSGAISFLILFLHRWVSSLSRFSCSLFLCLMAERSLMMCRVMCVLSWVAVAWKWSRVVRRRAFMAVMRSARAVSLAHCVWVVRVESRSLSNWSAWSSRACNLRFWFCTRVMLDYSMASLFWQGSLSHQWMVASRDILQFQIQCPLPTSLLLTDRLRRGTALFGWEVF